MKNKFTFVRLAAASLAVWCMIFAVLKSAPGSTAAGPQASLDSKDLPPALAVTTMALGPIRGLVANALWWRIVGQQDEGNYFEIIQLADWITTLQPRNAGVWNFQAWNMAYNVAYEFPDDKSKWEWIFRAYRLLAGSALDYNPGNLQIKKEIARIFTDRIGSSVDPGMPAYRKNWAAEMTKYLPLGNRDELKLLASAPDTLQKLKANPEVRYLLEKAAALGIDILDQNVFYNSPNWSPEQRKIFDDIKTKHAFAYVDAYFRTGQLKSQYRLDPKMMLFIDQEYGPFDWRLYQAHAIYWAADGRTFKEFLQSPQSEQILIRQAMTSSFLDGKLLYEPAAGIFVTTSNFRIIAKLHDYYEYMMTNRYSAQIDGLHRSFLEQAIAILYSFNQVEAAKEAFEHYQEGYGNEDIDFETYVAQSMLKTLHNDTSKNQRAMVESSLFQAYNWLATGDTQRSMGYANLAKLIWGKNQKENAGNPAKLLPPLKDMMAAALKKIMESSIAPQYKARLLQNIEMKEFTQPAEKAGLGEIMGQQKSYSKRDGTYSGEGGGQDIRKPEEEQ